ncbi:hypothetical protein CPB84DRAFT_1787670 [Gymnopilus junonius]|uniref:Uncharacterized protein n=1 Tax=Gymnopilus junonius TaxID=109634 RepID=A0A9P5NGF9_GYMJU|nr:hypothetical protein CPB84DRAFT_1787670 [Gymnopilus junonius]
MFQRPQVCTPERGTGTAILSLPHLGLGYRALIIRPLSHGGFGTQHKGSRSSEVRAVFF